MSETKLLIKRIFSDFTESRKHNKGHLFPVSNGFDITGKQNRINAMFEGIAIGAPELIWVIGKKRIAVRVKTNDKYLRVERDFDAALHNDGFQQKFIFSIEEWRKFYDKTLKECKKKY